MSEGLTGNIDSERRFVAYAGSIGLVLITVGLYLASVEGWGDEASYAYFLVGLGGLVFTIATLIVSVSSVISAVERKQKVWAFIIVVFGFGWIYYILEWISDS